MCCSSRRQQQACFSCGRRGNCHRRRCAMRQPGYDASACAPAMHQQPLQDNSAHGFDSDGESQYDALLYGSAAAPPTYIDVCNASSQSCARRNKFADFFKRKSNGSNLAATSLDTKEHIDDMKALEYAFEAGRMMERDAKK